MSKAFVEFDHWIVCPKCHTAMVGEVGEECSICHIPCVATPLYPDTPRDIEGEEPKPYPELGREYTPEEEALLHELGLE